MENIKELFEKETKLKLRKTNVDNAYYECTGISYRNILIKIADFNYKHKTNIYATNDTNKDVTTIYLR